MGSQHFVSGSRFFFLYAGCHIFGSISDRVPWIFDLTHFVVPFALRVDQMKLTRTGGKSVVHKYSVVGVIML
ncbi:MAG: hypothetical protein JWN25_390 [Verrucomicrobiales bacterium]|nr:hypothetical protein [Verrucomicrobiales bacterium]